MMPKCIHLCCLTVLHRKQVCGDFSEAWLSVVWNYLITQNAPCVPAPRPSAPPFVSPSLVFYLSNFLSSCQSLPVIREKQPPDFVTPFFPTVSMESWVRYDPMTQERWPKYSVFFPSIEVIWMTGEFHFIFPLKSLVSYWTNISTMLLLDILALQVI